MGCVHVAGLGVLTAALVLVSGCGDEAKGNLVGDGINTNQPGDVGSAGNSAVPGAAGNGAGVTPPGAAGARGVVPPPSPGPAPVVDPNTGEVTNPDTGQVIGNANGVLVTGICFPLCLDASTDVDALGVTDGYGFEFGVSCIVEGSPPTLGAASCEAALPVITTGAGFLTGGVCVQACVDASTDVDLLTGATDGYGFEFGMSCIVEGSVPALASPRCDPAPLNAPPPGDGFFVDGVCLPTCANPDSDAIPGDGFSFELGSTCVVGGAAVSLVSFPCIPIPPVLPEPGDGFIADLVNGQCLPACGPVGMANADVQGFGFEDRPPYPLGTAVAAVQTCVVAGSPQALNSVACIPPALPGIAGPLPANQGWLSGFSATVFGQDNCAMFDDGFSDVTRLESAACSNTAGFNLNAPGVSTYFGAPGDLSAIWVGNTCQCNGQGINPATGRCQAAPGCDTQICNRCFEVACDPGGDVSFENNGDPHNRFCRTDQSVVVQVVDVCPALHPSNTFWCTSQQRDHIDISCSAMNQITQGALGPGAIGYTNVFVRPVDCAAVTLGPQSL